MNITIHTPLTLVTHTFALLLLSVALAPQALAQSGYISDELTVPLRSGPSNGHRILHRGLPSGTKLTVLAVDEGAGFSQIRTERGTEGWVRTQYLVNEPIAKIRLATVQRELARTKQGLSQAQTQIRELRSSNANQASASRSDQNRIEQLETELAEIKSISANAVAAHHENMALTESNARLRDELDDMAEERSRLEGNAENQAILYGAGFVLLGLIAGVAIKSRPQRSAWN